MEGSDGAKIHTSLAPVEKESLAMQSLGPLAATRGISSTKYRQSQVDRCINESDPGTAPTIRYYATHEEKWQLEGNLRAQLQANPFGPRKTPETLLNLTQSFTIVENGRFVWEALTPVNFFQQYWFENTLRLATLERALKLVESKTEVQRV
ncbi:hypothetical protein V1527DRAFT_454696 [Lipomyces starkeyi]